MCCVVPHFKLLYLTFPVDPDSLAEPPFTKYNYSSNPDNITLLWRAAGDLQWEQFKLTCTVRFPSVNDTICKEPIYINASAGKLFFTV